MSSETAYKKVVRAKLSFKGDQPSRKTSSNKPSHSSSESNSERYKTINNYNTYFDLCFMCRSAKRSRSDEENEQQVEISNGTGRFTSSGTTIHGHFTEFVSQLSVGDAIIVTHPTSLLEETKVVRMVLSNTSIGISSAFSSDLISTTPFRYIKAPKDMESEEKKEHMATQKRHKVEEDAFGTYASKGGSQFTYRVKKGSAYGGYAIVTERTDGEVSREDLLDRRSKKKADRHCY